jgi:ribose transport system permease protein
MAAFVRLRHSEYRGILVGIGLLAAIFALGAALVPGYGAWNNVRSIIVLAAFLGIASLGQTLVALVGGLDLSIPFVIGSANILLAFLLAVGLPTALAIAVIALGGALVGAINGRLSYRIQGQSLIVTLGVGFALVGASQIVTTLGTHYSGSVFTQVPAWFSAIASVNGTTFGLPIPPIGVIWGVIALVAVVTLRRARRGREIYAVGDNRTAAARLSISEYRIWMTVHIVSAMAAALTGMLLLGFSGGGFVGVGDPYLFTTVAAVVVGGTSLLGGAGGYGATVLGALVLQTLTSLLVGLGFNYAAQQTAFGLILLPMVALYARAPHIRSQI